MTVEEAHDWLEQVRDTAEKVMKDLKGRDPDSDIEEHEDLMEKFMKSLLTGAPSREGDG